MSKLLEIDNLVYSTGNKGREVKVSAVLRAGGILNVRGPSGSGKTTLLRILARLRESGQGRVILRDRVWTEFSAIEWRRKVHYLAQKPVIFDGSVEANLARPFELAAVMREVQFDRGRAKSLVERLFPSADILKQDARTLSGGEAARMCLIRALLVEPELLLLDEPLAALDHKTADLVLETIAAWAADSPGRGVVLVSHVGPVEKLPGLLTLEIGEEAGDAGE